MKALLPSLFFFLLVAVGYAEDISGTGIRREIKLHAHATFVRIEFELGTWNGDNIKIVEGCPVGTELHNPGFLASTPLRPFVLLTNSRLIASNGAAWKWSWYFRHSSSESIPNSTMTVSFVCIEHCNCVGH